MPNEESNFETLCRNSGSLRELGGSGPAVTLSEVQRRLEEDFAKAAGLSDSLEERLQQFWSEREHMDGEIDQMSAVLKAHREKLIGLDSLTGDENDLARRLNEARVRVDLDCVTFYATTTASLVF